MPAPTFGNILSLLVLIVALVLGVIGHMPYAEAAMFAALAIARFF